MYELYYKMSKFVGKNWNLTLPIGLKLAPKVIEFPEIDAYKFEFFEIEDDFILMGADVHGVTTKNSKYPRCEFRELTDGKKAAFETKGKHTLDYSFAIVELPGLKPEICIGQLHDSNNDVFEVRCHGSELIVQANKKDYKLGKLNLDEKISVKVEITDLKVSIETSKGDKCGFTIKPNKGLYFKVGCYVQANPQNGTGRGFIKLYNAKTTHSLKLIHDTSHQKSCSK